jgi:hypothetical protein
MGKVGLEAQQWYAKSDAVRHRYSVERYLLVRVVPGTGQSSKEIC